MELTLNFLKVTNNYVQSYDAQETMNHAILINNLTRSFTLFSHLFNNFRKIFATFHKKIASSYFFIYQFNISKFTPSLGLLLNWGTFKNSFFLRYVTNEIRFTPAALHWGDLIFNTFDSDSHKFVISPMININSVTFCLSIHSLDSHTQTNKLLANLNFYTNSLKESLIK
jgi:hypothetical protein